MRGTLENDVVLMT